MITRRSATADQGIKTLRISLQLGCLSLLWSGWIGMCPMATIAPAQELREKGIEVRVHKANPPFLVNINVDRPNRMYQEGDVMKVVVRSGGAGYLYLFYTNAAGSRVCIFPNSSGACSYAQALQDIHVPDLLHPEFDFVVKPPFGKEILKAFVLTEPSTVLPMTRLHQNAMTPVDDQQFADFVRELQVVKLPWGETDLIIQTVKQASAPPEGPPPQGQPSEGPPAANPPPPLPIVPAQSDGEGQTTILAGARKPNRVGLFVGLSRFKAGDFSLPSAARTNAQEAAAIMERECELTTAPLILLDDQATLKAVESSITDKLRNGCQPGDYVFIYWSGRIGRTEIPVGSNGSSYQLAERNQEDAILLDYLLPYDGDPTEQDSLILETTFARWLQMLDKCNITIILDSCTADGAATGKSRNQAAEFLRTELVHTKSLGDLNAVLLSTCVSQPQEYAVESASHSRMTEALLETLQHDVSPLTLFDTFVKMQEKNIPTTLNDPVLARQIPLRH